MFVVQMARREIRASWRRLLFFFVCIALGVGSIVALRSIIRNLNVVITGDARAILTADIQLDCTRPWNKETLDRINRITQGRVLARSETIEAGTMMRPADVHKEAALLVELKGIEPPFPFYGSFALGAGRRFEYKLLENHGVIVAPVVLERLGVKVGDRVKIGDQEFVIRGTVEHEPGGGAGFRFGPRVLVLRTDMEKAGLTGFGSRSRRKILLKAPEDQVQALTKTLQKEIKDTFVRVRSFKDAQDNLNEHFTRAENFLSLMGLIILVLGGIGISSVTRVFIEQKRKTIAILKCVGATGRKVIASYLIQVMTLGVSGSVLGIALAAVAMRFLESEFAGALPREMSYALQKGAIEQGLGIGILVTILFSALPLLRIRHIKPNVLLRDEAQLTHRGFDWLRWSVAVSVGSGLVALASWQAGSIRVGIAFLGGLLATSALLLAAALLLIRLMRKIRRLSSFEVRHAINSLYRPGNQTRVIVLAVGLGAFFVIATQAVKDNLLREMDFGRNTTMPNMYLIDIQKDQREGVEKIIRDYTGKQFDFIPTLRARIYAVNGKALDPESKEFKKDRRRLAFEYTITYRQRLESTETVTAGKFWDSAPSTTPEISIEESLKDMMGLDVGGTLTFDLLGRKITGKVTSIRHIDWNNARTGFYVLFRPGALESAPQIYIAAIDAPAVEPQRSRFQRDLVDHYPNVTAIDVMEIVRNFTKILNHITLAVSFVGGFVFLTGVLILAGSIAMTKFQRIYETAVLKTLGAKRRMILTMLIIEYGILGSVAGLIGSLAATGLSYAMCKWVFEIPWEATPLVYVSGVAATLTLVLAVGAISSFDVLTRKPLAILRGE